MAGAASADMIKCFQDAFEDRSEIYISRRRLLTERELVYTGYPLFQVPSVARWPKTPEHRHARQQQQHTITEGHFDQMPNEPRRKELYKTLPCCHVLSLQYCQYGDNCHYKHPWDTDPMEPQWGPWAVAAEMWFGSVDRARMMLVDKGTWIKERAVRLDALVERHEETVPFDNGNTMVKKTKKVAQRREVSRLTFASSFPKDISSGLNRFQVFPVADQLENFLQKSARVPFEGDMFRNDFQMCSSASFFKDNDMFPLSTGRSRSDSGFSSGGSSDYGQSWDASKIVFPFEF